MHTHTSRHGLTSAVSVPEMACNSSTILEAQAWCGAMVCEVNNKLAYSKRVACCGLSAKNTLSQRQTGKQ